MRTTARRAGEVVKKAAQKAVKKAAERAASPERSALRRAALPR